MKQLRSKASQWVSVFIQLKDFLKMSYTSFKSIVKTAAADFIFTFKFFLLLFSSFPVDTTFRSGSNRIFDNFLLHKLEKKNNLIPAFNSLAKRKRPLFRLSFYSVWPYLAKISPLWRYFISLWQFLRAFSDLAKIRTSVGKRSYVIGESFVIVNSQN